MFDMKRVLILVCFESMFNTKHVQHILIHCPPIRGQRTNLLSAFGASWVPPFFFGQRSP